jgi:hypothetical protein
MKQYNRGSSGKGGNGCVEVVGSPEYAMNLNDFMVVLRGMMM